MASLSRRFGQLLAAHRKQAGYTQFGLGAQSGLSVDLIAKLETAQCAPSFASVEKLATVLSIDPAQLFTDQIGGKPFERRALTDLVAELAKLSEADLLWVTDIVRVALKTRR